MASKQNIAQYPNGFSDGVTIRGLPILNTYSGQIWWVDSNGAQIGDGKFNRPFATIDTAINHASAGDTILVKAGHTETITAAAGIDADVAGISIIGLGQGRRRPTISFTTADTADIDIDAANVTIQNIVFSLVGVASLAAPIDVNAADFTLQGCEFIQSNGTNQCLNVVAGAAAADRMRIIGNTFRSTTAGAVSAISLLGTADGTEIIGNYISGDYSTAAISNAVGNVLTNLLIDGNYIRNDNTGDWAIELVSASTGVIQNNTFATDAIATAVDWGACAAFNNLYFDTSDTDSNATAIPTAQTTGGMDLVTIGDRLGADADTDAIGAMLGGAAGIATIPAAAVPANNVNVFELLRQIWANQCGTAANENGIATFPAVAAPANNVSIAEVLHGTYARAVSGINPLGVVVYVAASGGSDSNAGTSPTLPKATLASAITAAGAGGTIVLGPGTHNVDVSAAALTPLANQQFVSAIPSFGGAPRAVIANDADDGANIVVVDVDGTVWRDIEFRNAVAATTCVTQFSVAQTTAVRGIHFENCWFNQNGLDGAMISVAMNDATNAVTGAVFKNCRFVGATGTTSVVVYIEVGIGGTPSLLVEECVFQCQSADNDARALNFLDPGAAGKSYGFVIRKNQFIGPSDGGLDAVPLQFAAAMTEDEIIGSIAHNHFTACATPPIPIDLVNNSVVDNWGGDNATGGTKVDPGT